MLSAVLDRERSLEGGTVHFEYVLIADSWAVCHEVANNVKGGWKEELTGARLAKRGKDALLHTPYTILAQFLPRSTTPLTWSNASHSRSLPTPTSKLMTTIFPPQCSATFQGNGIGGRASS